MSSDKAMICNSFEKEVWLYLDESLPDKETDFWHDHISGCETCKNLLKEIEDILSAAELDTRDIDDSKFNMMIERATADSGFSLYELFTNLFIRPFKLSMMYRAALTGALVIAVIFISPAFREKDIDKIFNRDLLNWNGTEIDMELNELQTKLSSFNQDRWTREIDYIDSKIDIIKQDLSSDLF